MRPGGIRPPYMDFEEVNPVAMSIYDQLVPPFTQMLESLDKVLSKAEADASIATRYHDDLAAHVPRRFRHGCAPWVT